MRRLAITIFTVSIAMTASFAMAMPVWTTADTMKKSGKMLTLVCRGEGVSLDIARSHALNGCKANASDHVISTIDVKSLAVESNQEAAFHQEVAKNYSVSGLECSPLKEHIGRIETGFEVWVQCQFDLGKAAIGHQSAVKDEPAVQVMPSQSAAVSGVRDKGRSAGGQHIQGTKRTIVVTTVPGCDDILVRGGKPRSVACRTNPMNLVVSDSDKELVFRASGHQPKRFDLGENEGVKNVQIVFD